MAHGAQNPSLAPPVRLASNGGGKPRFSWTYADEDMVGPMVEVAQAGYPSTATSVALLKWVVQQFGTD